MIGIGRVASPLHGEAHFVQRGGAAVRFFELAVSAGGLRRAVKKLTNARPARGRIGVARALPGVVNRCRRRQNRLSVTIYEKDMCGTGADPGDWPMEMPRRSRGLEPLSWSCVAEFVTGVTVTRQRARIIDYASSTRSLANGDAFPDGLREQMRFATIFRGCRFQGYIGVAL